MIIPIRCFTCNKIIADLYKQYIEMQAVSINKDADIYNINTFSIDNNKNIPIFKKLGIERYCCKRHFLTHVEIIDKI